MQNERDKKLTVKKTALYEIHKQHGAKLVEFAGFYMPIQYKGINDEHLRIRKSVGLFDVSHMGEFEISGPRAEEFLQYMTINDVSKLKNYQVQYSAMCYENGGIVDDMLIYRYPERFLLVVNASNLEKDFNWLQEHLFDGVTLKDRSDEFSLVAIQGKDTQTTLQKVVDNLDISQIKTYWFAECKIADAQVMIARTGYTGEDGFEVMSAPDDAANVWNALMDAGKEYNIEPIGLGARDTLRLEVKYCLYGNDIDQTTNPLEAGLGWITKLDNGDFIGKDVIQNVKDTGLKRKLIGFEIEGKAIPRHGYKIVKDGEEFGVVTSGMFSPLLQKPIGLGYVRIDHAKVGSEIQIDIRGRLLPAKIVKTPFYKRPS